MKHSTVDENIQTARRLGLEAADKVRNNVVSCDQTNVVNVVQQNSVRTPKVEPSCDSPEVQTKDPGPLKLPGTSVRLMQKKSKSMSCDSDQSEGVKQQNKENVQSHPNEGSHQLKRSFSAVGPISTDSSNTKNLANDKPG